MGIGIPPQELQEVLAEQGCSGTRRENFLNSVLSEVATGFEREAKDYTAGPRTHMLVGFAAACYCLLALDLVGRDFGDDVRMDPVRMIEAVTGGVAFLPAGLSVFTRGEARELTPAPTSGLSQR